MGKKGYVSHSPYRPGRLIPLSISGLHKGDLIEPGNVFTGEGPVYSGAVQIGENQYQSVEIRCRYGMGGEYFHRVKVASDQVYGSLPEAASGETLTDLRELVKRLGLDERLACHLLRSFPEFEISDCIVFPHDLKGEVKGCWRVWMQRRMGSVIATRDVLFFLLRDDHFAAVTFRLGENYTLEALKNVAK